MPRIPRDGSPALADWYLPVGSSHEMQPVYDVRTPQQREVVRAFTKRADFGHACNNPFSSDMGTYEGAFTFSWVDTNGTFHATRMGKRGKLLSETVASNEKAAFNGE